MFLLGSAGYAPISESTLVPGLDFDLLARFVRRADQPAAVKEFRDLLLSV